MAQYSSRPDFLQHSFCSCCNGKSVCVRACVIETESMIEELRARQADESNGLSEKRGLQEKEKAALEEM